AFKKLIRRRYIRRGIMTALEQRNLFFFSSSRRHTRCLSDWSSDVCSSDLRRRAKTEADNDVNIRAAAASAESAKADYDQGCEVRSEERRVGKEYRGGR